MIIETAKRQLLALAYQRKSNEAAGYPDSEI